MTDEEMLMCGSKIDEDLTQRASGMTLRDYFAASALSHPYMINAQSCEQVAEWAYNYANAMLTHRSKP